MKTLIGVLAALIKYRALKDYGKAPAIVLRGDKTITYMQPIAQ